MKILFYIITLCATECVIAARPTVSFESLDSSYLCALGTIRSIRELPVGTLHVSVSDLEELPNHVSLLDENLGKNEPHQTLPPTITLALDVGLGGSIYQAPSPKEWIDRKVLFVAKSDTHRIPTILFDLSPDGTPFYVFGESEQNVPASIKKTILLLGMTNGFARAKKMISIIETSDEDLFVKRLLVNKLSGMAPPKQTNELSIALRARLLEWRDGTKFNPAFRLFVDARLVYCFPEQYQIDNLRIDFLEKLKTEDSADLSIRRNVDIILRRAEQIRQRIESEQVAQETATNAVIRSAVPSQSESKENF
jgi:hypothetical protein